MAALRYRCPTTNNEITTAIDTASDVLSRMSAMNLKIWVWCPHCAAGHQIKAADALLQNNTVPPPAFPRRPETAPRPAFR